MNRLLKIIFFGLIVKPIVFVVLGLNIRGRNNLPRTGPAVLVANHNSHLDTMVLMGLYPLSVIHKVRPVAAADYFLDNGGLMAWFSTKCIGIIPMDRSGGTKKSALFKGCNAALDNEEILILFPEGSRGNPEEMSALKKGVFHLVKDRPDTEVTPVMIRGLGKVLPKGEALLVPFNCDVIIGNSVGINDNSTEFMEQISNSFTRQSKYCLTMKNLSS